MAILLGELRKMRKQKQIDNLRDELDSLRKLVYALDTELRDAISQINWLRELTNKKIADLVDTLGYEEYTIPITPQKTGFRRKKVIIKDDKSK